MMLVQMVVVLLVHPEVANKQTGKSRPQERKSNVTI